MDRSHLAETNKTRPPLGMSRLAHGRPLLYALVVLVPLAAGLLIGRGDLLMVLGAIALVVSTGVAWRWPLVSTALALLAMGGYTIFQMTPDFVADALYVGGGVYFQDVVLVGMVAAAILRLAGGRDRRRVAGLFAPIVGVSAWLVIAVLRNLPATGLSAPGELRFRYLLLAIPLCLVASLQNQRQTRAALWLFVSIAVGLPLVLSPVVLSLKGWSFSWSDRLFPAQVSMGLLLGLTALWQCRSWLRVPRVLLYVVTGLGAIEIILDSHRSVWLGVAGALVILSVSKSGWVPTVRRAAAVIVAVLAATLLALFTRINIWSVLAERGQAALERRDTAGWRELVWESTLEQFYASPTAGRGLGLYWSTYVKELGGEVTIFPHSLYVMILAHLGVVGMLLFVWLWFAGWRPLLAWRKSGRPVPSADGRPEELAWLGMAVLAGSAAWGIAYGFEPYSLTLAGVCLAGVLGTRSRTKAATGSVSREEVALYRDERRTAGHP